MSNYISKEICFDNLKIVVIKQNNNFYIDFKQFCEVFKLSYNYYFNKAKKLDELVNTINKIDLNNSKKVNILNIKNLENFLNIININKVNNKEKLIYLKENFNKFTSFIFASFESIIISDKEFLFGNKELPNYEIKDIYYENIEYLVLKNNSNKKYYVALKKLLEGFGINSIKVYDNIQQRKSVKDFINNFYIYYKDKKANITFLELEHIYNLVDEMNLNVLPDSIDINENFISLLKNKIEEEFEINKSEINPDNYKEALDQLKSVKENNNKLAHENIALMLENEEIKVKAQIYDMVVNSRNAQNMKQVANVFGLGRNKLFDFLREQKVLLSGKFGRNLPYQKYIDSGYFIVKRVVVHRNGGEELYTQTLVTAKGLGFISKLLRKKYGSLNKLPLVNNSNQYRDVVIIS